MGASGRIGEFCALGAAGLVLTAGPLAYAETPPCPVQAIRWQEDCSALAGQTLTGLDRLRYLAVGPGYLTLGGEARVRIDALDAAEFGIGGGPDYVQFGHRFLFSGDLHASPHARLFAQLVTAEETGRRPSPRTQDRDGLELAQLFADIPAQIGPALVVARIGRQELDLAGNRLVTTRDGVNIRRAFNGATLMASAGDLSLNLFHLRPMKLRYGAFDDWPDPDETFDGATADVAIAGHGKVGAFLFDRTRPIGRWLDSTGASERRWTAGARYSWVEGPWSGYAQGAAQWGHAKTGEDLRGVGAVATATYSFATQRDPRLVFTSGYASGDGRRGDGVIETFDPLYPSNNGFSDSPLLYQTNYAYVSGQGQVRVGPADLGAGAFVVGRASTGDAIYAQGRPIDGTAIDGRLTAYILQTTARIVLKPGTEIYSSVSYVFAGQAVRDAGGADVAYFRLQLTAEF